jgi:hypothetical protein
MLCCAAPHDVDPRSVEGLTAAELQQVQSARVTQLTAQLTALLKTFVEGDEAGFKVRLAAASAAEPSWEAGGVGPGGMGRASWVGWWGAG